MSLAFRRQKGGPTNTDPSIVGGLRQSGAPSAVRQEGTADKPKFDEEDEEFLSC